MNKKTNLQLRLVITREMRRHFLPHTTNPKEDLAMGQAAGNFTLIRHNLAPLHFDSRRNGSGFRAG